MPKDTQFYDKESATYSEKRYVEKATNYVQYFFGKRLSVLLKMLEKAVGKGKKLSLLEIGCADGIIMEKIQRHFPETFSSYVGIDISPKMIEAAQRKYTSMPFTFFVRNEFTDAAKKDVIIEIGVINYTDLSAELSYARERLADHGTYIISLAGTNSLWNKFRKGDAGFQTFDAYQNYEQAIKNYFDIVATKPAGIFIPFVWRWPWNARIKSNFWEAVLGPIAPNLFHEKIYVLKKKN